MLHDPFSLDEREAQRRSGGGPPGAAIRDRMPEQHRLFFASLRTLVAATADPDGWPAARLLTGSPGFAGSPDAATLHVATAEPGFSPGQVVGLLGIDLATRRRNRLNGDIVAAGPDGFTVRVRESFGNCPKYIQRRDVAPAARHPGPVETLHALDGAARRAIAVADTVFVASRARSGLGGMDASHRGGRPGFIRVDADRLTVPEFPGNRYCNTLGNLLSDDRAALLFPDFERGDLLHLQGRVSVDWAEGRWTLAVERGWRRREAVPLRWSAPEPSPFLDAIGAAP